MGATLTCLATRTRKDQATDGANGSSIATLSPVHSIRRRSRSCSFSNSRVPTLQVSCVNAVATALVQGYTAPADLSVLPYELLQEVVDRLVARGEIASFFF